MRDRTKYVTAASLIVAGLTFLAVTSTSGQATALPPGRDSATLQAQADRVFTAFNGTQVDRDAGAVLQAHALNGGMDECMSGAGFPEWDWSLPRAQNPPSHGLESSRVFSPPLSRAFTTALASSSDSVRADADARRAELSAEEMAAVRGCLESTPRVAEQDAVNSPAMATALREDWWALLGKLDTEFGSAYEKCLEQSQVPGLDQAGSRDEAVYGLTSLRPADADLPTGPDDARFKSPEWQRLLAVEADWEAADWSCRASDYNAHIDDVASAISNFEAKHAVEIAQARQGWVDIMAKAKALGYQPGTYGPIDTP